MLRKNAVRLLYIGFICSQLCFVMCYPYRFRSIFLFDFMLSFGFFVEFPEKSSTDVDLALFEFSIFEMHYLLFPLAP